MKAVPTPRTDRECDDYASPLCWIGGTQFIPADFARTLERELTEARATLLAREGELDSMSAALAVKDAEIERLKAHDHFVQKQQVEPAIARAKEAYTNRSFELLNMTARAEKAEAERDALRTLWTEARVVVAQSRDANCLASYGKAQCDAVAAANAWLDKMPATVKRTIDDAGNAEWQLQRVTAERDQLRAEVENIKAWGNAKADEAQELRADLAAAKVDSELLNWLADQDFPENVFTTDHGMPGCWTPQSLRAAIDAARKAQP